MIAGRVATRMACHLGGANDRFDELRHVVAIVLLLNDALDQFVIVAHRKALVDLQRQRRVFVTSAARVDFVVTENGLEGRQR